MTVPSQADLSKRKANRDKLAKKITEDGHLKEQELVRIIRKAIDSAWMTAAHKLVFLEDRVIPDMDDSTRTKWLIRCNICEKLFKLDEVQVDHRIGEFPCTNRDEFQSYLLSRLDVGFDDLQILCADIPKKNHIGCHQIKTLGERYGLSFDDAKIEKQVIDLMKKKASEIDKWLLDKGVKVGKNKEARRNAIREILKREADKASGEQENAETN